MMSSKFWSFFSASKPNVRPPAKPNSQTERGNFQLQARRALLAAALKDTLNKHGVPDDWIRMEVQSSYSRDGEVKSHVTLVIKRWNLELLQYCVDFQNNLVKRIFVADATSQVWLKAVAWSLNVPDENVCPPMPSPSTWTQTTSAAVIRYDREADRRGPSSQMGEPPLNRSRSGPSFFTDNPLLTPSMSGFADLR